jgi:hypothetical protein
MTPKEKAKELVGKFQYNTKVYHWENGWVNSMIDMKECALICLDEILIIMNEEYISGAKKIEYWQEVKKEIELL